MAGQHPNPRVVQGSTVLSISQNLNMLTDIVNLLMEAQCAIGQSYLTLKPSSHKTSFYILRDTVFSIMVWEIMI